MRQLSSRSSLDAPAPGSPDALNSDRDRGYSCERRLPVMVCNAESDTAPDGAVLGRECKEEALDLVGGEDGDSSVGP
jgi:hypothetical protein